MGYESLSTVIVLVVVVLVLAVWLPRRTVNGMKHVMEHREDRYSSSLHLVDADSGTKFSDVRTPRAKGAIMQPTQSQKAASMAEHIAQVRRQRRAAARRRAVITAVLAGIVLVVLILAAILRFSPLFALIPVVPLAAVLALGANAARHARAWERKVAARRRSSTLSSAQRAARKDDHVVAHSETVGSDAPTETMEQREIRRALRAAEQEKARIAARRAQRQSDVVDVDSVVVEERSDSDGQVMIQRSDAEPSSTVVHDDVNEATVENDATVELTEVRPVDQHGAGIVVASQDLISFTLGAPREGYDVTPSAPESLEIRSTRQVAKAIPVDDVPAEDAVPDDAASSDMEPSDASTPDEEASIETPADTGTSFHDHEVMSDVEPPTASSESLGTGLEAILARRGA